MARPMEGFRLLALLFAFAPLLPLSCLRDPEPRSAEDTYAGRYADAKCGVMGPCCTGNGLTWNHDSCVLGGAGYTQSGVDAAKQHGAVFDPVAADECIRLTVEATRQCTSSQTVSDVCGIVFTGKNPPGSACTSDLDCAGSADGRGACYWTSPAGAKPSGLCVIETRPAKVGDVCGVTSGPPPAKVADCAGSGLQCTLAGTCQPLIAVGGTCGTLARCVDTAYCDGATGQCASRLPGGAACAADSQCTSGLCLVSGCASNGVGAPLPCSGRTG